MFKTAPPDESRSCEQPAILQSGLQRPKLGNQKMKNTGFTPAVKGLVCATCRRSQTLCGKDKGRIPVSKMMFNCLNYGPILSSYTPPSHSPLDCQTLQQMAQGSYTKSLIALTHSPPENQPSSALTAAWLFWKTQGVIM